MAASSWPNVSEHGVELLLKPDTRQLSEGEKKNNLAIVRSTKEGFDKNLEIALIHEGFEKMSADGVPVFVAEGTKVRLTASLLKRLFGSFEKYELKSAADQARIRYDGEITPWVEPVAVEEVSGYEKLVREAAEGNPIEEPSPAEEAAAPVENTPDDAMAATATNAGHKELGTTVSEQALPEGFVVQFGSYLVHEGVPREARDDFLAAVVDITAQFSFAQAFEDKTKSPQDIRRDYKPLATNKELAKSRVVDCVVPFVRQFLQKSDEQRHEYVEFASEHTQEMDAYIDELTGFMDDFVKVETAKNVASTYERNLRMTGARAISILSTIEDQAQFNRISREFAAKDERLSVLNSSAYSNYKLPITKVRKNDEFRERLDGMWADFKSSLENSAPAP